MLVMALIGLSSCNEDLEMPPLTNPDAGGDVHYGTGEWNNPITINQVLAGTTGKEMWFTGYIVGWIDTKGGTVNKFTEETVTFTTPATLASNIVMAATPDEKDLAKCIPVQLPTGAVRSALNLVDNPGNLGKQVTVKASVEKYFGQNEALKSLTEFNWGNQGLPGGENPNPPVGGEGNGSAEQPYSVAQMLSGQTGTGVWVSGYIVGYIKSNTTGGASTLTAESATFSATDAGASNMMLADSPTETDYSKCTAINLPTGAIRTALNLKDNPGNLGKQVSIKGDLSKYFGVNGLRNASEYNWGPTGTTGGGTVTPGGDAFWTGLNESDATCDWTFDNVNLPEGASYIWQWKEYNAKHYLNASAYVSGSNLASLAWAVSPEIDLSALKTASVSFEHAAKFQTTLKELCGFGVRVAGTTEWTEIAIPTWPEAGAWTFANSGNIDLSAFAGKKIQIGFKYASSTAGADTWEIKNVKISGTK